MWLLLGAAGGTVMILGAQALFSGLDSTRWWLKLAGVVFGWIGISTGLGLIVTAMVI